MKDNTMAPQTTFKQLELSQLRANKSNIRTELTDIEELADSIKAQGLLQPLLVTPHPEVDGDYLVIGGHRRLAASTAAGLLTVPCMVAEGFESLPEQIEAMLSENTHRSNLTVVEEADAYQQLLDFPGYTVEKIAKKTGRSESTVRRRVALKKLSSETQAKAAEGVVTLDRAVEMAEFASNPLTLKALESVADASDWAWQAELKRAKARKEWDAQYPQAVAKLEDFCFPILESATEAHNLGYRHLTQGLGDLPADIEAVLLLDGGSFPMVSEALETHEVVAVLNNDAMYLSWYGKPLESETEGNEPAGPSEEELAEQAAREKAETALRIDRAAAQQYLEGLVQSPTKIKGAAHKALAFCMANAGTEAPEYARLLGAEVDVQELSYVEKRGAYFDAFLNFTTDQLATAMALNDVGAAFGYKHLFKLNNFNPSQWDYKLTQSRLELLSEVYGLDESTGLRLAREYWEPALPGTADAEAPAPVEDEVNF